MANSKLQNLFGKKTSISVTVVDTMPRETPHLLLTSNGTAIDSVAETFGSSQTKDAMSSTVITYDLAASSSPDFSPETIIIDQRGLIGFSYTLSSATPSPDGACYWKVSSSDGAGNATPYSAARTVVVYTVAPTVSVYPHCGTSSSAQSVALTASEPAITNYTTDGTDPALSSTVYLSPFVIFATIMLQFFAKDAIGNPRTIDTEAYSFNPVMLPAT
ncbi:MAG TPA: chitobiase/beta-hexosaminidase C-terminal domain-containing protein [Nitrososphaera sp.]|nr:chitobiase/beta-hexosaminidase C-terminal domain-containing protein [Nitrososphaera sp.]